MKKLSLLIALCMLISIGGVYAAWVYTNNSITPKTGMSLTKEMGDVEFLGAAGAYTEVSNTLKMLVVPEPSNYYTDLDITGELVIKFTPDARITPADKERAMKAVVTVIGVDLEVTKYLGEQIYSLVAEPTISTADRWAEEMVEGVPTGAYLFTLRGEELEAIINIARINLPNYTAFLNFQSEHQHAVFKLNINAPEATAPAT